MLSFFSGLLGFSSTQNTSGSATNRELKRLERVSKELQRLETQASPLSPRRSTSSNVLPSTIKKVQEDSGKSHSLAISKVLSFDQISDMGENTPTAEMCSHSQPLLRNISDDKEATAVVAKRKRDTETQRKREGGREEGGQGRKTHFKFKIEGKTNNTKSPTH